MHPKGGRERVLHATREYVRYRRNLIRPEILTFDELYERARFVVEAEHKNDGAAN
jgi:hypothetical protein